ncbi:MAG: hypothetical protein B6242_13995 [Anaerolineaceae bacterium 4572_78]|nr:MAG: hypothetical protein B6242_13995 [Anaerolineaceae bacterium 4572_78]
MIQSGIVKIFAKNGTTSGTGFVAKADGLNSLIVTCAHVIQNGQHKPGDEITVVFHANNTEERLAVVEKEWWRDPEHEDIAVLRLKDELPINARSLLLGKAKANVSKQRGFVSFGYPDLGDVQESSIEGNIGALVENDTRLEINSPDIEHGASGAPVFDTIAKRVIGVIKGYPSHNRGKVAGTPSGRLKERNYAIPAEVLFEICPLLSPHYECPYQGLKPFNETTSQFFFGRKTIIEDALSKLNQKPPVLGIVGASGSGKSSLIRAGLFPALEKGKILNSQNWKWLTFRPAYPTFNPIDNLVRENERVLNSDDLSDIVTDFFANNPQTEHLIIFADQFEELFVRCTSEIREHFLNNLDRIRNNSKVTFIYAVRGDFFYDYIINNARLYEKGYRIDVGNVSETELRDIITEPAREASLFFVPDELPENIAKKASEAKNPLPLLQETLLQLYNQAKKRIELPELTSQAFDDIGGSVTGSIGRWAEQSYRELDRERQKLTKRIFLKLVDYEQERLFRRTRELSDLVANETERNVVYDVVNSWVKKRLLVIGENQDSIELVHDALIVRDKEKRVWNRLSGWIDEHKDFLMWRRGFEFDYNSYREKKGDLLSGNTLLEAERWLNQHREWLDLNEQLYIELSIGKREQELAVREAVRKRNFRWSIGAIVILAVLLIAAVSQWGRAENEVITRSTAQADAENARAVADTERIDAENARATADAERVEAENAREMAETRRQEAEEQRNIAESQRLSALAQLAINQSGTGYIRSGLLSIESLNLFSNSGSALTLQNSVKLFPSLLTQTSHSGVTGVIFSPDGKLIATWGADQIIQIWDVKSGKSVISLNHQLDIETASNYNPPEPSVERWSNYRNLIYDNLLTEDGNFLDTSQWTHSVNFSFDGKKLVSATGNDVKVWDIPTGNQVYQLPQQNDLVTKSFFSPDDELLVTVSNNKVKVWDANTGQPQTEIAHKKEVRDAEFSFDGKLLATAGLDGIVQIWNIENTDTFSLTHNSAIFDIDFSSDGKMLAAAGQDGVAHIWDITKSTEIQFPHDNPVISVKFWNDDKYLVTNVVLGTAIMWDIDAQALVKQIHNNTSVTTLDRVILDYYPYSAHANSGPLGSFSPFDITFLVRLSLDEKQIVTIGNDSTVRIWQADKNVNLIVNESRNNYASALINPLGQGVFVDANFSPDSGLIATASADGIIQLWQIKSDVGIVKAFVPPPKRGIKAISVSPDGRYLTIGEGTPTVQEKGEEVDRSGQVKIWDMYTQKEIVTIPPYSF